MLIFILCFTYISDMIIIYLNLRFLLEITLIPLDNCFGSGVRISVT